MIMTTDTIKELFTPKAAVHVKGIKCIATLLEKLLFIDYFLKEMCLSKEMNIFLSL
jgi:hypothetical protein